MASKLPDGENPPPEIGGTSSESDSPTIEALSAKTFPKVNFWDPKAPPFKPDYEVQPADPAGALIPEQGHYDSQEELKKKMGGFAAAMAPRPRGETVQKDLRNIIGWGIGPKMSNGYPTGDLAVKVYVRKKVPRSRVAGDAQVQEKINGYSTDVVEVGNVRAQSFSSFVQRPVPYGTAIAREDGFEEGTLGCLVVVNDGSEGGRLCILSNNHVLANLNQSKIDDPIVQPGGSLDQRFRIASLFQWVNLNLDDQSSENILDAAVAQTSPDFVTAKFPSTNMAMNLQPRDAAIHNTVRKFGCETELTMGEVTDVNANVSVTYDTRVGDRIVRDARVGIFTNQILIQGTSGRPFSDAGDSGSLVVLVGTNQPLGLLFGGSPFASFANPIRPLVNTLGIRRFVAIEPP